MSIADPQQLDVELREAVSHALDPFLVSESPASNYSDRCTIFPQPLFLRMVCLERKRAERSGRRLILMLLKSDSLLRDPAGPPPDNIVLALSRSSRDTDITGWYRQGAVIGVLFTEISAEAASTVDILSHRVRLALHDVLGIEQTRDIELSFHVFPDDCQGQDPGCRPFSVMYPDLVNEIASKHTALAVKRCIDVIGSLILLVLLSPLLLLIASAIKLTSRGPVIFRQTRLGQFGRGFTFLKFRSMYTDTDPAVHKEYVRQFIAGQSDTKDEASAGPKVYKLKGDARVTKIGNYLRRTSLDELPQLFNVLAGQMSLVGPRPPVPYEFESYAAWHKSRLLKVKPGITGLWQVQGRSRVKFNDMVRMDLHYAKAWSLWLDIKILLRTPLAVFTGNGAY